MSFQNVEDWLRALGLLHYAQAFYDNGYDTLDICKQISLEDLNVIGIKNEKDRTDIEIGVHQLGRDVLYFELVPEDGQQAGKEVAADRKKIDEVQLKSIIKEELELRNAQLTEPPYFYPDGTLGDLFGLAVSISLKLQTYAEDVFGALEQMQKRQLPAGVFEEEDEVPQEYLNVENPQGPQRTFSMSKYDKRVTKSTTDIHAATTDGSVSDLSSKFNKKRNLKAGGNKQAFGHKILQSFRKKTPTTTKEGKEVQRSVSGAFNASDVNMTQDEILFLLGKVKTQEMSQDEALGTISRHLMGGSTTPTGKESQSSANSSPEMSHKKTRKQKKSKGEEVGTFKALLSERLSDDSTVSEDSRSITDTIPEECESQANSVSNHSPPASSNKHHATLIDKVRQSLKRGPKGTGDHKDAEPLSSSSCSSSQDSIRSTDLHDSGCTSIQIKVPSLPNARDDKIDGPSNGRKSSKTDKPARTAPPPPLFGKSKSASFRDEPTIADKPVKKLSLGSNVNNRIQVLPPLFPPPARKEGSLPNNHVDRPCLPPRKDRSTSDPTTPTAVTPPMSFSAVANRTSAESLQPGAGDPPAARPKVHPVPRRRPSKDNDDAAASAISSALQNSDAAHSKMKANTIESDRVVPRVRPVLPPRPPKGEKTPSPLKSVVAVEHAQSDLTEQLVNDSLTPETRKKLLKTKPLKTLIATKLRRESINISDEPYTCSDGTWNIPSKIVERYSEELDKSRDDVVESLDALRKELRHGKCEAYVPVESVNFTDEKTFDPCWSVHDWLLEIGLPMFAEDLRDAGIDNLRELVALEEEDLKDVGVYELRHVKRLLLELKKITLD